MPGEDCTDTETRFHKRVRQWRARNDERGAALVEFGLVIPIFVMLILGSVTLGLAYNDNNSLNNGAREAGRFAATLPVDTMNVWLNDVADAAEVATNGAVSDGATGSEICIAYVYPAGDEAHDQTTVLFRDASGTTVTPGAYCFEDGRPNDERRVQVLLGRESQVQAIVYTRNIELEARSVVRYERGE